MGEVQAICDRYRDIAFVVLARQAVPDVEGLSDMAMTTNIQNGEAILELLHLATIKTTSIATERGDIV